MNFAVLYGSHNIAFYSTAGIGTNGGLQTKRWSMSETKTTRTGAMVCGNQKSDTGPLHLLCRLQWKRLRAWKKRSLRGEVSVEDRIRPQAYSSSSSGFRGFLDAWCSTSEKPAVLWIVTSYRLPGRQQKVPSLAAKIHVRSTCRGDDDQLTEELKRYVVRWKNSEKEERPQLCRVVEAEPALSRFFPANDMGTCLSQLRYINRNGSQTEYSPRRVLRVRPEFAYLLKEHAEAVARRTVFISYKHIDFTDKRDSRHPTWTVKELAGAFISGKFGVWLDALCAPPKSEESPKDLSSEEVRLLLKEGHAQSAVVIGIETDNYLKPGEAGHNWTLDEYEGTVGGKRRDSPLLRFVLHGGTESKIKPSPDDAARWSEDLHNKIVPRVTRLITVGVPDSMR